MTDMTRDTTATTDAATGIETGRGCCGSEPTQQESTCCGEEPTEDGRDRDIEIEQRCCGTEPSEAETSAGTNGRCCGSELTRATSSECGPTGTDSAEATPVDPNETSVPEQELLRDAATHTEALLGAMADAWTPEWTETDVAAFLHERLRQGAYEPAWSREYCPAVNAGPDADVGHTLPGDRTVQPGELLHVDFGVSRDGYVSDIQRTYYRPAAQDGRPPAALRAAFEDVRAALAAGLAVLEPGVRGHEVDAAARETLTERGWSGFNHAFGHQVGRLAHDGGTLLGPLRERYGDRARGEVSAGEVYSVELGVGTTYGFVGLEEMVRVVEGGTEFLVDPQTELRLLEGDGR